MLINMFQGYASHAGGSRSFINPLPEPPASSYSIMLASLGEGGNISEVGPSAGRASNLHIFASVLVRDKTDQLQIEAIVAIFYYLY